MNAAGHDILGTPAAADLGRPAPPAAADTTAPADERSTGARFNPDHPQPRGASQTTSPTTAAQAIPGSPAGPAPQRPARWVPSSFPTCGVLWGAAPAAFDFGDRLALTRTFEAVQGRPIDVYHGYKSDGILFPSAVELSIANDPTTPRLLLINWRPDTTHVEERRAGRHRRSDRQARGIHQDGIQQALLHGDLARAGALRQRDRWVGDGGHRLSRHGPSTSSPGCAPRGVTKGRLRPDLPGFPRFATLSWWPNLYPGDDVIDWIASDSYNSGKSTGYNSGDFNTMVNRVKANWNGFYNWATTKHPASH